ncbi:MAG: hypothetical protein ACKOYJ_06595 [Planctomycetia bacterium]
MLIASFSPSLSPFPAGPAGLPWLTINPTLGADTMPAGGTVTIECAGDPDEDDDDLGDEEDLPVGEPLADEESTFDDFDDDFDDDFEEEENDPDWDHPDDSESEEPPPAKGPSKKK